MIGTRRTRPGERKRPQASSFIVRVGGDGLAPGSERLDRMGIVYDSVRVGTSLDAAMVVAAHSDASAVVTAWRLLRRGDWSTQGLPVAQPSSRALHCGSRLIGARRLATFPSPARADGRSYACGRRSHGRRPVVHPWGNDLLYPITSLLQSLSHRWRNPVNFPLPRCLDHQVFGAGRWRRPGGRAPAAHDQRGHEPLVVCGRLDPQLSAQAEAEAAGLKALVSSLTST